MKTYLFSSTRLQFRQFTRDDADALIPILSDKEVMEYGMSSDIAEKLAQSNIHVMSPEDINAFLQRAITSYKENGYGLYAIIKKDDNILIGYCGLKKRHIDDSSRVEIIYRLAKRYWGFGQGLCTKGSTTDRVNSYYSSRE